VSTITYVCCLSSGTEGLLTTTPQNVLVKRGENAVLNCSTDSASSTRGNPMVWHYDNTIISYRPCTSQSPGFITSSPDPATDCNIEALASSDHGISGVYRCGTGGFSRGALATVIVLGEMKLHDNIEHTHSRLPGASILMGPRRPGPLQYFAKGTHLSIGPQ